MKKAGDLLGAFFDERVLRAARGYSELFTAWRSLVGEQIAAHSRIAELDKAILIVETDHPGWIQILQTKQAGILEGARKQFPELSISGISFRLAKDGVFSPTQDLSANSTGEKQSEGDSITDSAEKEELVLDKDPYSSIKDEAFKELLVRLEKSIATKNKTR
jgi:hypothetical protein